MTNFARLKALALVISVLTGSPVLAQTLTGTVNSVDGNPLSSITIAIPALNRRSITDSAGNYRFSNLRAGSYLVECNALGYTGVALPVVVTPDGALLNLRLEASPLEMAPVVVTAMSEPIATVNSSQPVASISGGQLERQRGEDIIQTIQELPGLNVASRGPTNGRPIIRGLSAQRVVVAENGIRYYDQQWHDEESPGISTLDVERVEVERGPNSVLYGSDALGGVVNVIRPALRFADEGTPALDGECILGVFSNNRDGSGELLLRGAHADWGYRAAAGGRSANDLTTPDGRLKNSGASEFNATGELGIRKTWGDLSWDYVHLNRRTEIYPDPDGPLADINPFQQVHDDRLGGRLNYAMRDMRLEVDGGWQRNETQITSDDDFELVLQTLTLEARAHHKPIGHLSGTGGVSVVRQENETGEEAGKSDGGEEGPLPGFRTIDFGGFVVEQMELKKFNISAGLRIDSRRYDVEPESTDVGALAVSEELDPHERAYNALSGSVGGVWHVSQPLSVAVNLARGWRAPDVQELFVNSEDLDARPLRHIIGNPELKPEASLGLDATLRYAVPRLGVEAALFVNRISRYIYSAPTGEVDSSSGIEDYAYRQADATFIGGELRVQAQALNWLLINLGTDAVRAQNEETGRPLPLIPPLRALLGVSMVSPKFGPFRRTYFEVRSLTSFDQKRVDTFESPTGGYTLIGLSLGGELGSSNRAPQLDMSINNLFDRSYFDHLSRYKDYALSPGRNVIVRLTVPFTAIGAKH